ncbi:MAG: trypsin-like peptidase domain-containing protein [Candidatus Zixiibacteriota bacterium]
MRKTGLIASVVIILSSVIFAQSGYQKDIYDARDKVLPALIHIQPVVYDYISGHEKKHSVVGSGVIISKNGYAVTNYHVAGRAERIICTLHDREQVPAELIGGDPATDLAVIKLDLTEYKGRIEPAVMGNSDNLQVGQTVLAMGSPLALSRSVSIGVISTLNRFFSGEIRLPSGEQTGRFNTWLQTDAAINPGNSGGPLVNLRGEVVGINTRGVFYAENIGFSIPINIVKEVSSVLIEKGKVDRSWIGVHAQPLQELENFFGTETNKGVLIASVDPESPADEAGLEAGQIILNFDGHDVSARFEEELPSFYKRISMARPGEETEVVILSNGNNTRLKITPRLLGELQGDDFDFKRWGFTAKSITRQMAIDDRLSDTIGVYITQAAAPGPAFNGGLRSGDVIRKINKDKVLDLQNLKDQYEILNHEEKILLTINRRDETRYILLTLDGNEVGNE